MNLLSIGIFGLLGVFARYFTTQAAGRWLFPFPGATFAINLTGSFLAGFLYVAAVERMGLPETVRIGIFVGFLGGFTTFSAYCLETARLLETQPTATALLYFGLSPVLGLAACVAGLRLARIFLTG